MTTYVALLRGINVGGRGKVAMADLRALCDDLGHGDVRTYVQSGNVVFTSERDDPDTLGAELSERVASDLGVEATVVVRTADELAEVAGANPFPSEAADDPTRVHVAFLSDAPSDPDVFAVDAERYAPEQVVAGDRVLYLHLPDGIGRSKLAADLARRRTDVAMTVRNWRTVDRLLDLAGVDADQRRAT